MSDQSKKPEGVAPVVNIFSKKKLKKAEIVITDLSRIEQIIDSAFKELFKYKHYVSAAEVMFVINENRRIISAHKKKYEELSKKEE